MLTQSTRYATIALAYVAAAEGKPVLVRQIAEACGIPGAYLSKIVNRLARAGVVMTQRGVGGGVTLNCDPEQYTLMDLCDQLDDPAVQPTCLLGSMKCCDTRACPAHPFQSEHRRALVKFLESNTLAEIARFEMQNGWQSRELGPVSPATPAASPGPTAAKQNGQAQA